MEKHRFSWLLSPWTIGLSVLAGIALGIYLHHHPSTVLVAVRSIAYVFLSLLQMCVVPLIITAVTGSFAKLLMSRHHHGIRRIVFLPIVFIASMVLTSIVGIAVGQISGVGLNVDQSIRGEIGGAINRAFSSTSQSVSNASQVSGVEDLLHSIVSSNVIKAAVNGQGITIIIFSVLLGLSLGFITSKSSRTVVQFFDGLFEALLRLVNGLMYLLPIGLLALFAEQIAKMGIDSFLSLYKLVLYIYIPCLLMTAVCLAVIARRVGVSWFSALLRLREMMTIAFASSNGFSALPFGLNSMEKKFQLDKDDVNLLFPISISLNFIASSYLFALMAVFMSHFYTQSIGPAAYLIIVVGSVLTAIAVGSIPAIASFTMIGILFQPLGLPIGTAVAILLMISQAIDPVVTLTNVTASAMWVALFSDQSDCEDRLIEAEYVVE